MAGKVNSVENFETLRKWFIPHLTMEVFKADRDALTVEYGMFFGCGKGAIFQGILPVKYPTLEGFQSGIFNGEIKI